MNEFTEKMREAFARDLAEFSDGRDDSGDQDTESAEASLAKAQWLREYGSFAEAAGILCRISMADPAEKIGVDVERARLHREMGQFEVAVGEFLAILEYPQLPVSARIACLNNLAWLARRYDADLDLAEHYLAEAATCAARRDERNRKETAETKHQLAVIRMKQGDLRDAELLIDEVIRLREALNDSERLDVARSLLVKGAILEAYGKLDLALKYHQETLAIREAAFGLTHADVADTLYYLGDLYKKLGRLDDADATYGRAGVAYENAASTPQGRMALACCHSRLADAQRRQQLLTLGIVGVGSAGANAGQIARQQT